MTELKNKIIVALDVEELAQARDLVQCLQDEVGAFKIGKQMYTRYGPEVVQMIHDRGGRVFLDLKYHDIPTTVAKAAREVTRLNVFMFNMHALGGLRMMQQAVEAVREAAEGGTGVTPLVLAVTVLTSMGPEDLEPLGLNAPVEELVTKLAALAKAAGMDGVVASPNEIQAVKERCGRDFLVVTPGIRPAASGSDDQKRIMTPGRAVQAGVDYIVVGRPIAQAADPAAAARAIAREMEEHAGG